jgi:hypothetical protein
MTISTAGTVVSGRDIQASGRDPVVSVNAPNVTIRNSRVRGNGIALIQNNSTGLTVEDSELVNVDAAQDCGNGIALGNYVARRIEITGCENGASMDGGNATLVDSWIHNLDADGSSWFNADGPHTDGIESNGPTGGNRILHNNIDPLADGQGGGTSGIIAWRGGDDVRIEDNRIDGRGTGYAIYAPRTARSAWFINRNRMLKGFGYTACVRLGNTVTEFNGNVDDITGASLGPDNGFDGGCTN